MSLEVKVKTWTERQLITKTRTNIKLLETRAVKPLLQIM